MKAKHWVVLTILAAVLGLGLTKALLEKALAAQAQQAGAEVPKFEVDPFWPKLPEKWALGAVPGLSVGPQDHIWIIHRPSWLREAEKFAASNPPEAECCIPAPQVLEFDAAGNYIQGWGGPGVGYEWPAAEHGIHVDYKGNVWLAGNGRTDNHVLKFTRNGEFLLQIGHKGQSKGSDDIENLNRPADFFVYPETNELFVADGYQNRRVIVFDADTGAYKRHWGAYGNRPDDAAPRDRVSEGQPQQFNTIHGVRVSNDEFVYVADRLNNRIQVFTLEGEFVKEAYYARQTRAQGSIWSVEFSRDPQQQFLYGADGSNQHLLILNRQTLRQLDSLGRHGRLAGQFFWLHSIGVDSQGNVYTAETQGQRVQKFVFKGLGSTSSQ